MSAFPDYLDFGTIVRPVLPMRAGRYIRDVRVPEEKIEAPELALNAGVLRDVDGAFMNWGFKTRVTPGETFLENKAERSTERVRIEDPDDSDTFIEVERMREAVFTDEQSGRKMRLRFESWDDTRS
jgi:hypothetical protein